LGEQNWFGLHLVEALWVFVTACILYLITPASETGPGLATCQRYYLRRSEDGSRVHEKNLRVDERACFDMTRVVTSLREHGAFVARSLRRSAFAARRSNLGGVHDALNVRPDPDTDEFFSPSVLLAPRGAQFAERGLRLLSLQPAQATTGPLWRLSS